MKRPEVTLQNQAAVYEFYRQRAPGPGTARLLHALFGAIYHPQVGYAAGAAQAIGEHFAADGRVLLTAKHALGCDPLVLAALVQQERPLRPLRGNVSILAYAGLFANKPIRPFIDNFGALPTFRYKDNHKSGLPGEQAEGLRTAATGALLDICIHNANDGINIALFPEGSRKTHRVRGSIGKIACGLDDPARFRIVPVGIDYSQTTTNLRPNVFIGTPEIVPPTPEAVTALVETAIYACFAGARNMS